MPDDTARQIQNEAVNLYQSKKYKEALDLYRKLYTEYRQDFNEWDARYYSWCIYYLEIKNKKNEDIAKNEQDFFKAVNAILNLTSNNSDLAHITAVFKVLDYLDSKALFPTNEILNWTAKLDPSVLKTDCFSFKDKEGKTRESSSLKEKYYSLRTKALEKNKNHEECLKLSKEALSALLKFHYDNDIWFGRRIALCKGYLGQKEQAIEELKQILSRKKDWFIQYEIASFCFDLERFEEALQYAISAVLSYGEAEKKVGLFFLLGRILQAQAKTEEAKKHILLSYQLRSEKKWKIPPELESKITELQIDVIDPPSSREIFSGLRGYWQSLQQSKQSNPPKLEGKIKNILPNGLAGFIAGDNNKDYFFSLKDCGRKKEIVPGLRVGFNTEKSYDKKKERESEKAINIVILE